MVGQSDIVHLHLPQFDAPGVAFRGRLYGKPVILTYHSDLRLPPGIFNRLVDQVVHGMNRIAGNLADAVVTYTYDFGSHSPFLSRYLDRKLHVIPPPVEINPATPADVAAFRNKHELDGKRVIGISARLAAEKGIEVLLAALPAILVAHPNAHVLQANPDAIGEEAYASRLEPLLKRYQDNYHLLGPLHGSELTAFYRNLDCLVMCSLNNTETFGLVQIEAMINGVPSVASDLPGVRQPVRMTGMGEITPVGDQIALAKAIIRLLNDPSTARMPADIIIDTFSPDQSAQEYLKLFRELSEGKKENTATHEPEAYERLYRMRDSIG
jgi:glycosyltransferase involved in cell wall biosynthesis